MLLLPILLVGLTVLAVWAIRDGSLVQALKPSREVPIPPSALEIARVRLARGEITPDEYAFLVRTLGS